MIAEIQPSFASHTALSRKVEYHLGKIDEGNARVLYTSTGSDLSSFPGDMRLVSQLNDRVKLPYSVVLFVFILLINAFVAAIKKKGVEHA